MKSHGKQKLKMFFSFSLSEKYSSESALTYVQCFAYDNLAFLIGGDGGGGS